MLEVLSKEKGFATKAKAKASAITMLGKKIKKLLSYSY